jgi:hypothetical protein
MAGLNLVALNETLSALDQLGRLERVDSAVVQALRSMASALDFDPQNAALWGRYLSALDGLLGANDDADSDLAAALAEIRGSSEVGDSPPS